MHFVTGFYIKKARADKAINIFGDWYLVKRTDGRRKGYKRVLRFY